jgi:hypothetical protein
MGDKEHKICTLKDSDIVTTKKIGRRAALSQIGAGVFGSVAIVVGTRSAHAADTGDNDVNTVADYKWNPDADVNKYADAKNNDYNDITDIGDNDSNYTADSKSAADGDVRNVADARDRD